MLKWREWWTEAHADAAQRSMTLLLRQPWSSLMTIIMIAMTVMLAALCWTATEQCSELNAYWHQNETMSLYLKSTLSDPEQRLLLQKIQAMPEVESATLTTPAEGLALLAQQEGMQTISQSLPYNPLPAVIQVIPNAQLHSAAALQQLYQTLKMNPAVNQAKFDSDWIERLYSGFGFLKQLVFLLTLLFALSMLLVIGNTLRLLIHNRRAEIQVLQLLGASHQFIRRPFLFTSLWYGLLSSLLAIIFVDTVLIIIRNGVNQWAETYHMHVTISLLPFLWMLGLIGITMLLSWTGARLTLKYYL
jgi:cell division transport system permease protein